VGKKHTTAHEQKTDEEEITINFGWLKNIFSSKKEKYHDEKEESEQRDSNEEEISLDFGKTLKRLSKYGVIFLILIPLILSIYIRTMPERMPIAEQWARESIYRGIANQFTEQVNNEYPGLSEQTKQEEINRRTNEFINQQYAAIEQAAKQQAEGLRDSFRDQNGYTYLGDIDSYYWLRYARNILEKGTYGDEIREGREYDNHMIAPEGYGIQPNIYPYVEAYLYKFLTIFNPKLDLMQAGFYTPLFLSFFAIIAAFFIGKKLSGNLAGFMAATLIAVNPTVLSRSLGSDNDIVNAVFPLLIMLFMIYAFDSENLKKTIIYTLIGGFLIGLYSFAWSGGGLSFY